jgi:MFS family permease
MLAGMALMGLTTFLPMFVQGVLHRSPIVAGLTLTMLVLVGSLFLPAGALVFVGLTPESSPVTAACGSLVMGLGMGLLSVASMVLIQEIVDWSQRGSVTASNLFSRNLGSTLGATVLGAVLNYGLGRAAGVGAVTSERLRQALETPPGAPGGDPALALALQDALRLTFWAMLLIALLIVVFSLMVPRVGVGERQESPAE